MSSEGPFHRHSTDSFLKEEPLHYSLSIIWGKTKKRDRVQGP